MIQPAWVWWNYVIENTKKVNLGRHPEFERKMRHWHCTWVFFLIWNEWVERQNWHLCSAPMCQVPADSIRPSHEQLIWLSSTGIVHCIAPAWSHTQAEVSHWTLSLCILFSLRFSSLRFSSMRSNIKVPNPHLYILYLIEMPFGPWSSWNTTVEKRGVGREGASSLGYCLVYLSVSDL